MTAGGDQGAEENESEAGRRLAHGPKR
jgi:hypothetical protein